LQTNSDENNYVGIMLEKQMK